MLTTTTLPDADGDGVPDDEDAFSDDPAEWRDTDGDGVGDAADLDDDDGMSDADGARTRRGSRGPRCWMPRSVKC
jgi:hypothetical protein